MEASISSPATNHAVLIEAATMADALPYYMVGCWRLPTKRLIRVFVSGLDGDLYFARVPIVPHALTPAELAYCETDVFSDLFGRLQRFNQEHPGILRSPLLVSQLQKRLEYRSRWDLGSSSRAQAPGGNDASLDPEPKRSASWAGAAEPVDWGQSSSTRLFGELLVDEKIITPYQLEAALRLQAVSKTYVPIGQVLLTNKLVTRKQLTALLQRHNKRSRLGDILLKAGCITSNQLKEALTHQRRTHAQLGQILIELGYVSEAPMRDALCTQLHINFFDLDPIWIDPSLARLISERFATRHLIVPIFRVDDVLVLAMDDPSQAVRIEDLQLNLRVNIEVVTATKLQLIAAMHRLYKSTPPRDVNVFGRRDILIGPIRDHLVAQLAATYLDGLALRPHARQ